MEAILLEAEKHVSTLLNDELKHHYMYHNLSHTQRVVAAAKEIIEGEKIVEDEANKIILAAWFHDAGYTNSNDNHEEESVTILKSFLKDKKVPEDFTKAVSDLILATKMGVEPQNLSEKIIRDADCAHFKDKDYSEVSELLRNEWEFVKFHKVVV